MTPITMRCSACGGSNIMRDAWSVWDDTTQSWVLGAVFDAAYCDACETDATLVEAPLVKGDASVGVE